MTKRVTIDETQPTELEKKKEDTTMFYNRSLHP
jgi:hypothetical protein